MPPSSPRPGGAGVPAGCWRRLGALKDGFHPPQGTVVLAFGVRSGGRVGNVLLGDKSHSLGIGSSLVCREGELQVL